MSAPFPETTDQWILESGPRGDVVVSSRARLARNLPNFAFAPRSRAPQLALAARTVQEIISRTPTISGFKRFDMSGLGQADRRFLRESHLISSELEKGREFREVYLSPDARTSIMINEEDHLRIQSMMPGLQLNEVYSRADGVESELDQHVTFAYSSQFGYLTACPTNAGTGLRVSVMLHLVGLVMSGRADELLNPLNAIGLTVRGGYGEHSNHAGDLYQISNEITLGRSEEDLIQMVASVAEQVIEREYEAREELMAHARIKCEDGIERALGLLTHARLMTADEAVGLLSPLRLGIGNIPGLNLTHERLSRLMIEVQPAHIIRNQGAGLQDEGADGCRAAFLRAVFTHGIEDAGGSLN